MDNKINEIRSANDIVEVISSYIPLTKKGKNFFGVCPFHDDTNPSMSVSEDKQIYKCFSCGASGNVFNFVMDYENIDFKEALNILAKRAGITVKNLQVKTTSKYQKYYEMYQLAVMLYRNNLDSILGKEAKEYLKKRQIEEEVIKHFKIGLSTTKRDDLTKILTQKGYTLKELDTYGLGNGTSDLYINRIMFPLFDIGGKPVGFSGRIYNTTSDSKYMNTKETPIFKKGEILYNYYEAKDSVRLSKKLIITEGFMDVIRLYTIGIKNVIALMGTSLTKEQITLIKRLSNNIYLSLDGDNAGKKATATIGKMLEQEGLNVSVIELSNNLDPDEFILKEGASAYESLYNNPISYSDFMIKYLKQGSDLTNIEEQTTYINKVIDEISLMEDELKQELFLNKISKEFNIEVEILRKKLQNKEKYSKIETLKKEPVKENKKLDKYQKCVYEILNYMVNSKEATKMYERKLNYMPYATARYLANEIIYYYKINGNLVLADFLTFLNEKEELLSLMQEVLKHTQFKEINFDAMEEYINVIKGYNSNQEIKRLKKLLSEEPDPIKKAKIANKIRLIKMGS